MATGHIFFYFGPTIMLSWIFCQIKNVDVSYAIHLNAESAVCFYVYKSGISYRIDVIKFFSILDKKYLFW